jgi:hypothetical protein
MKRISTYRPAVFDATRAPCCSCQRALHAPCLDACKRGGVAKRSGTRASARPPPRRRTHPRPPYALLFILLAASPAVVVHVQPKSLLLSVVHG